MTLDEAEKGQRFHIARVQGERSFRRRLMELGLIPGTEVALVRVAPLGDPLELEVRGCRLSMRRAEARGVELMPQHEAARDAALSFAVS